VGVGSIPKVSAADGLSCALMKSATKFSNGFPCWRLALDAAFLDFGSRKEPAEGDAGEDGGDILRFDLRAVPEVREPRGVEIRAVRCGCSDCNAWLEC